MRLGCALVADRHRELRPLACRRLRWRQRQALDDQVGQQRRADLDSRGVDVVDLVQLLVETTEVGEGVDGVLPLRGKAIGTNHHVGRPVGGQGRYLACVGPGRIATAGRNVVGIDPQPGDA